MAAQSAEKLFIPFDGKLTDPQCVQEYFNDYYWKNSQRLDESGVIEGCRPAQGGNIQFKDLARFQMIESATVPIVIALDGVAVDLVESLRFAEHKGGVLRQLQRFTVQVYSYQFDELKDWCESPMDGVYVLRSDELYTDDTGLKCKAPEGAAFFG